MLRSKSHRRLLGTIWFGVAVAAFSPASAETDPKQVVRDALQEAGSIPAQAEILVELAWPDDPSTVHPESSAFARQNLIDFGTHSLEQLAEAVKTVAPQHQADVVAVLVGARAIAPRNPGAYMVGLDNAIWYGTAEARLLAIREAGRLRLRGQLLPIIDAALEHPQELKVAAVVALGQLGDARARFYLADVLHGEDDLARTEAATSLANIGGEAVDALRAAVESEDPKIREAAIRGLLPIVSVADLSTLHLYYGTYPDDNTELRDAVREAALRLEQMLEAHETATAASPPL